MANNKENEKETKELSFSEKDMKKATNKDARKSFGRGKRSNKQRRGGRAGGWGPTFGKDKGGYKAGQSARILGSGNSASGKWDDGYVTEGSKFSLMSFDANNIPGTRNGIAANQDLICLTPGHIFNNNVKVQLSTSLPSPEMTGGVMAIWLIDTLGANNNEEKSPLNRASILHKLYIDTALGVQLTFNAADLGIYFGALKSIYDLIKVAKRAINLSHNPRNLSGYKVDAIYKAMRCVSVVNPSDPTATAREISRYSNNYLDDLNNSISLLNNARVPAQLAALMDYTDPTYKYVYMDEEDSENAQFYIYMPVGWYEYDETGSPAGGQLIWKTFYQDLGATWNIPQLLDTIDNLINLVIHKSNSVSMAQKLLNAYGTENLYTIPTVETSDEMVVYTYDTAMLSSLTNMTIWRDVKQLGYTIDPNREMIVGRPIVEIGYNGFAAANEDCFNIPLQFEKDPSTISAEDMAIAMKHRPMLGYVRRVPATGTFDHYDVDAGNAFGFQIPAEVDLIGNVYDSNGDITLTEFKCISRSDIWNNSQKFLDWNFRPIGIQHTNNTAGEYHIDSQLMAYSAERDTEVTINHKNASYYFRSLAESVWGVDATLNVKGQRSIVG